MTSCKSGDVVLVRFPFTDLTTDKRRPALVVSPEGFSAHHSDVVLVPLTGRTQEHGFCLDRWREAGLLKPTWLKALIATVASSLIERRLGSLHSEDEDKVASLLATLIDAKYLAKR